MIRSGRNAFILVALALLPQMLTAGDAGAGKISGTIATGFDSFTEKYTIVEEDTLDRLTEFRTRLRLGYAQGAFPQNYFQLQGESLIGEESLETTGRINFVRRVGAYRLLADNDLVYRTYRDSSEYSFPNDFLRYNLRVYVQRDIAPGLSLRLTDRLEALDFDQRTEFDYDYLRNSVTLSADFDRDFTTTYHGALTFTNKSIPDSTEISYHAYSAAAEYRLTMDLNRYLYVAVGAERRLYENEAVKSPFWAIVSTATIHPVTRGKFGLGLENTLENYVYDRETGAFFDYVENRTALVASYFRSLDLTLGLGPTFAFFVSDSSEENEYTEYGARLAANYNAGTRAWLSASYEPGHRNYRVDGATSSETIFSDYTYHRLSLFATVKVWRGTSVNLFVNHVPENHKIEDDDATTTLFSLDVSYSF